MDKSQKEHIAFSVPGKKTMVPVYIGADIFQDIKSIISFKKYSTILVIEDENVSHHWSKKIREIIGENALYLTIPAGEKNKTLATVEKI